MAKSPRVSRKERLARASNPSKIRGKRVRRAGEKLKVLDWYCHQGHQYEFFKTGHKFYLCGLNGGLPNWITKHRPLPPNVSLVRESQVKNIQFDAVIIRSPLNANRYSRFIRNGAEPVAVMQTVHPYKIPAKTRHIIWNSSAAMLNLRRMYGGAKNHYIVHGYDPDEFKPVPVDEYVNRVLTVANHFAKRSEIMGYPLWQKLRNMDNVYDVLGSKNEEVPGDMGIADTFEELLEYYSKYAVFFNPTKESAMPRSRAEAAMCGMPIISTANYEFGEHFRHGIDGIITNDVKEIHKAVRKLLGSKDMQEEFGGRAREAAIKHFHIKDYLDKWNDVFRRI